MSNLTKNEKIEIANQQIAEAEMMIASSRKNLQGWLNKLEVRQEYLESLEGKRMPDPSKANKPPKVDLSNEVLRVP